MTASPLPRLHSVDEVAEALGETPNYVRDKCARHEWPHRRLARNRPAFSDDDYAAVLELIAASQQQRPEPRLSFAPRSRRRAS